MEEEEEKEKEMAEWRVVGLMIITPSLGVWYIPKILWSLSMNIHKQYGVYLVS